jgi:ferredoxin
MLPAELRAHLEGLLESGRVTAVLGCAATRSMRPSGGGRAMFARTPEELDQLTVSPLAAANLLVHLTRAETRPGPDETIAVLARGCEIRTLNQLFAEHALRREQVLIVGLDGCAGVVDTAKLLEEHPQAAEVHDEGPAYLIDGVRVDKEAVVRDACLRCTRRTISGADASFSIAPEQEWNPTPSEHALQELSHEERRQMWAEEFGRCIRCYACRDACPLCYCKDCVLARLRPQWIGRATTTAENAAFQLQRVLDLAGRCTECGECERACPEGLPLMLLLRTTNEEVKNSFGFESGMPRSEDEERLHPLSTFAPDDPGAFVL